MDEMLGVIEDSEDSEELKPLKDISEQPHDETELVGYVKKQVEESRQSTTRIAHESQWMQNSAYILGFAGLYFDSQTRQFRPTDKNTPFIRRNRIHVNKILPTIQNRLSKLCKNPPKYDVRPNSNNSEDKEKSRLSLQVLNYLWDSQKLNRSRIPLYMWTQQCGHSYIKVGWDPSKGEPMYDPETGAFMGYEGDVSAQVISAFEVFPDPMAKTLEDCKKITHCRVRKLDDFKMDYPGRGHLVKEEGAWLLSLQYESRINNMNSKGTAGSAAQMAVKHSAIEMIHYEARSSKHPNGRMIVCANGVLLENKELPCGEIPLAKFDDVVVAGKYYSESIVTHLIPIQDQYNLTITKRSEWTNKLLAGKYIAAKNSGLQQESLNNESGEVVYYTPVPNAPNGGMPTAMQLPVIPQYAYTEEDRLNKMFDDISGINEPSKGNMPSADLPAIGMQLLVEQSDSRIAVTTELHEESWAKVGRLMLKYVEKYYVLRRMLKVAGRNLEYTVKEFKGADLGGNTDVIVIRGSTLPGSKTLKRQDIENAYSSGLLGDPQDPKVREKVLDMMEFGDVAEIWQDHGLDMAQIRKGISEMEAGIMIQTDELDNHALWIQELNRYRKTDKWSKLGKTQVLFRQALEEHIQWLMKLSGAPDAESTQIKIQAQAAQHKAVLATHAAQMAAPPPPPGMAPTPPAAAPAAKPQPKRRQGRKM